MAKQPTKKLIEKGPVVTNKRARFEYEVIETLEVGIVLGGTEVKALRMGRANIADAFAVVKNDECFLLKANIGEYEMGNRNNHDPLRRRKLLLHKREIKRLIGKTAEKGFTMVLLDIHFNERGIAKGTLALVKGKREYDKRDSIKKRDAEREIARTLRRTS